MLSDLLFSILSFSIGLFSLFDLVFLTSLVFHLSVLSLAIPLFLSFFLFLRTKWRFRFFWRTVLFALHKSLGFSLASEGGSLMCFGAMPWDLFEICVYCFEDGLWLTSDQFPSQWYVMVFLYRWLFKMLSKSISLGEVAGSLWSEVSFLTVWEDVRLVSFWRVCLVVDQMSFWICDWLTN